jgi:hypothetical protein
MIQRPTDVRDPQFITKLSLFVQQLGQDNANQLVHDQFVTTASNWKLKAAGDQAVGKPIDPAPNPPLMTIYHDDGTIDHPPFPDLRTPTLDPPANLVPAHGIAADAPPPDRTDAILMQLQLLSGDIAAIKTALGVK